MCYALAFTIYILLEYREIIYFSFVLITIIASLKHTIQKFQVQ